MAGKLTSADWWFGRTPQQRARKARWQSKLDRLDDASAHVASAGQNMQDAGKSVRKAGLSVIGATGLVLIAAAGTVLALFAYGVPILFGVACALLAPARGRKRLTGYTLGVWLSVIYLIYLMTRQRVT